MSVLAKTVFPERPLINSLEQFIEIDEKSLYIEAVKKIILNDFNAARNLLKKAISINVENPLIYNLFGISYEKEGNRLKASKFYRVSYFMDQTFMSAMNNLERVCEFEYKYSSTVDWGMDISEVDK